MKQAEGKTGKGSCRVKYHPTFHLQVGKPFPTGKCRHGYADLQGQFKLDMPLAFQRAAINHIIASLFLFDKVLHLGGCGGNLA